MLNFVLLQVSTPITDGADSVAQAAQQDGIVTRFFDLAFV